MQTKNKKSWFTLIELLVVITIIGILATWWVNVFTKQLQWARDSSRITALKTLDTATNQYFFDKNEFPDISGYTGKVLVYVNKIPKDPKSGLDVCIDPADSDTFTWTSLDTTKCWMWYTVDSPWGLSNSSFKLWIKFEKVENTWKDSNKWPATDDWWVDDNVLESFAGSWANLLDGLDPTAF